MQTPPCRACSATLASSFCWQQAGDPQLTFQVFDRCSLCVFILIIVPQLACTELERVSCTMRRPCLLGTAITVLCMFLGTLIPNPWRPALAAWLVPPTPAGGEYCEPGQNCGPLPKVVLYGEVSGGLQNLHDALPRLLACPGLLPSAQQASA